MNMDMQESDNTSMPPSSSSMNTMEMDGMDMQEDLYDPTKPWYLRTLPGRTGDFMGHFIPGICFAGLGLGWLLLALYRAQRLSTGRFAASYIPENCPVMLRWFGTTVMMGTVVGMVYEILDSDPGFDSVAFTHCTLYLSYFIVGICALYESQGKLPIDTHRGALVLACILQALIWQAHGSMKKLPADGALHILLGYVNGATALVVAYSIRCTDSVTAYLAGWALLVVQGLWIILAGLYECCIDLQFHNVATLMALLCLSTFLTIALVVANCGPTLSDQDKAKFRGHFNALASDDMEDDELDNNTTANSKFATVP